MATEIITSFDQQCDANGDPMSGAKIYVYNVGTTTLRTIYNDDDLDVSHEASNPIVCDSAGRHDMRYTATGSYKIVVKTSADVTVYTRDNIDGRVPVGAGALAIANGGTGATSAGAALSNLGGATAAELADVAADVAALSGTLASSEKTHIATGTTAQRPATPIEGDIRRNTTIPQFEGYSGTAWEKILTSVDTGTMPTRTSLTSGTGATYTTPANCRQLRVRMIAGGGGGGASATNAGSNGTDSSFGTWTAVKGNGGPSGSAATAGGAGGTGGTDGTGTLVVRISGGDGPGTTTSAATQPPGAARGASSIFGGAGAGGQNGATGQNAKANTGSGGQGGNNNISMGGGGAAGEYVEFIINSPSATYTYTVGAGGAGGSAGGVAGGNGGSGVILVDEYY